jgi:flagellar biosynthesis/type III secretory pathway M-ring protein FliF/YscJ
MAGVELDEDDMRHRKIAEQIAEMIRGNPGEAATLVRKWVRTEE